METMDAGRHCQIAMDVFAVDVDSDFVANTVRITSDVGITYDNIQLQSRANVSTRFEPGKTK